PPGRRSGRPPAHRPAVRYGYVGGSRRCAVLLGLIAPESSPGGGPPGVQWPPTPPGYGQLTGKERYVERTATLRSRFTPSWRPPGQGHCSGRPDPGGVGGVGLEQESRYTAQRLSIEECPGGVAGRVARISRSSPTAPGLPVGPVPGERLSGGAAASAPRYRSATSRMLQGGSSV